jgi:hypothetical protein
MTTERKYVRGPNHYVVTEIGEALFHCWGQEAVEAENGFGNYTVAIVEYPDGSVSGLSPERIRFLPDVVAEEQQKIGKA